MSVRWVRTPADLRVWWFWWKLGIAIRWDCHRGVHVARVMNDGEIRCKYCGEDQGW